MASCDDMVEGSFSSVLVDSLKSNQSVDDLSPEDISWIDSCLVKDVENSNGDLTSMKDALTEIIGLQPETVPSHPSTPTATEGTNIEMLRSEKPEIVDFPERSNGVSVNSEEMETVDEGVPVKKDAESEHFQGDMSETSFRNAFLPHYREESFSLGNEVVSSSTLEIEPKTEDIFKVWDLGIPNEEDDLSKQLNKALSESSDQIVPSIIGDSKALKDLKEQSVSDLIAGLEDLSLNQQSD